MTSTVLVYSQALPEDLKNRLAEQHQLLDFTGHDKPGSAPEFEQALTRADAIIGAGMQWTRERIEQAANLKVISAISVGVDNYDVQALSDHGVALGHTPDVLTETTADTALALLLASARRVVELAEWIKADQWKGPIGSDHYGVNVHDKRLGIVGLGRIGQAVARRAAFGFSMDVSYYNRSRKPEAEKEIGLQYRAFDDLLSESDFICSVVPATEETHHLFNAHAFSRMPHHGIFINIGRGSVVDEDALVEALDNGQIRAAGLDVFQKEPVDANHPLVGRDDVVPLPHVGSATDETRYEMARLAVDNVLTALAGKTMPACYNAADLAR